MAAFLRTDAMPMILNEEQNMLKDTAREFCAENAPIAQLRRLRDKDSPDGFDRETWSSMAELGWPGIPFPEEHGLRLQGAGCRDRGDGPQPDREPALRERLGGRHGGEPGRQRRDESRGPAQGRVRGTAPGAGPGGIASSRPLRRGDDRDVFGRRLCPVRLQDVRARRQRGGQAAGRRPYVGRAWRPRRHHAVPRGRRVAGHRDHPHPRTSRSTTSPRGPTPSSARWTGAPTYSTRPSTSRA